MSCPSARKAVRFYQRRYAERMDQMGAARTLARARTGAGVRTAPCPRYLAHLWQRKAYALRKAYERWIIEGTLQDVPFADGNHAWEKAVREVQRVFPGTEDWLLSCSSAEGGHGRWVGYAGVSYSTHLRDSDTVGGPLQFRFSTFTGMFRRGAEYVTSHGFRLPRHLADMTTAWRSALGQAVAGGWARYTGNDNSHWRASWNRGCR